MSVRPEDMHVEVLERTSFLSETKAEIEVNVTKPRLDYEVIESMFADGEWRVEAINYGEDGEIYVAIFSGPRAEERAKEYAQWKSQGS